MKNNHLLYYFLVAVIVGGAAFYGGMVYGKSSQSLTAGGAQAGLSASQQSSRRAGAGIGAGSGVSGSVIAKDDKSITVQLRNGNSQFVFFSPNTTVMKLAQGTTADLQNGLNVTASGTTNSDGSVSATMIQIRPAGMFPGSGLTQQTAPAGGTTAASGAAAGSQG
jgi:hypothetical protein